MNTCISQKQIESTLTEKQIEELFAEHAVFVRTLEKGETLAVPIYKIIELFGLEIGEWTEKQIGLKPDGGVGILSSRTLSAINPYTDTMIRFVSYGAFRSIAAEYNMRKLCSIMESSEACKQWDAIWEARCSRLRDADTKNCRRRKEGKPHNQ